MQGNGTSQITNKKPLGTSKFLPKMKLEATPPGLFGELLEIHGKSRRFH